MKLRSKRVYLRPPAADDFEELAELYRSSRAHFRGYANSSYSRERFETLLVDAQKDSNAVFLVCLSEGNAIAGTLNFGQIFRKLFQNAYLGYQLFSGFTGKGYMTEAVAVGLHHAFVDLGLHRIEASVQPNNKPSIGVLMRNGFEKEGFSRRYLKINGRWRDHERWAILKEDWISRKEQWKGLLRD